MKYIILILSLFLFSNGNAQKIPLDDLVPVKLYKTTEDYVNKKPMAINAAVLIKDESRQHIKVKNIYDLNTGKKINKLLSAWAIEYKEGVFYNLGYSQDVKNGNYFVKFDIEGRYCAVIINENSPEILKTTTNYYFGGLMGGAIGAIVVDSRKWNKNWIDQYNLKVKILLVDTKDIEINNGVRKTYASGKYLSRKKLEEILDEMGITLTVEKIKDVKFEKVIEIIERANIKSID